MPRKGGGKGCGKDGTKGARSTGGRFPVRCGRYSRRRPRTLVHPGRGLRKVAHHLIESEHQLSTRCLRFKSPVQGGVALGPKRMCVTLSPYTRTRRGPLLHVGNQPAKQALLACVLTLELPQACCLFPQQALQAVGLCEQALSGQVLSTLPGLNWAPVAELVLEVVFGPWFGGVGLRARTTVKVHPRRIHCRLLCWLPRRLRGWRRWRRWRRWP